MFTIYLLNTQCLRNKIGEINAIQSDFSLLCFTEHWLNADELKCAIIDNYVLVSFYCRSVYIHGGVSIFVNISLSSFFVSRDDISELSVEKDIELCAVECVKLNILVVLIYRPPSGNFETFINIMQSLFELLCSSSLYVVVAGDFNLDFLSNTSRITQFTDIYCCFNLTPTIHECTRLDSCLDNYLTNIPKN